MVKPKFLLTLFSGLANYKEKKKRGEMTRQLSFEEEFELRDNADFYQVFYEQEKALLFAKNCIPGCTLPLFSYDKRHSSKVGSKKFVVGSYRTVYEHILDKKMRKKSTHFYEIMLPDRPTYIYVDAEYCKTTNPDKDENLLNRKFIVECALLLRELGIIREFSEMTIRTLVSSTDKKLSKHYLIVGYPWAMKNNYHCGAFVRALCRRVLEKYGKDLSQNLFFAWNKDVKEEDRAHVEGDRKLSLYMDLMVYTKHRNFRVYGSSKACANIPLLTEEEKKEWKETGIEPEFTWENFTNNLAQRVLPDTDLRIVSCNEPDGSSPKSSSDKYFLYPEHIRRFYSGRDRFTKLGDLSDPVTKIACMAVAEHLNMSSAVYFLSHDIVEGIVVVGTHSHDCEIKKIALKENSPHNSNHVYFVVHYRENYMKQKCHDLACSAEKPGGIRIRLTSKWVYALSKFAVTFEEKDYHSDGWLDTWTKAIPKCDAG